MLFYDDFLLRDNDGEIWKDAIGWEGIYKVSNLGRVKCNVVDEYRHEEYLLTQTETNKGYLRVKLSRGKDNKFNKNSSVHILVAKAFIQNPKNKKTVNHKKGNKKDNRATELEWATVQENTIHAYKNGLITIKSGQDSSKAKLRNDLVMGIFNEEGKTINISKKYGISQNTVSDIKAGRSWGHITGKQNTKSFSKPYKTNLTKEMVICIFNSNESKEELAKKYSISASSIWRIKSGTSFSDITNKKIENYG